MPRRFHVCRHLPYPADGSATDSDSNSNANRTWGFFWRKRITKTSLMRCDSCPPGGTERSFKVRFIWSGASFTLSASSRIDYAYVQYKRVPNACFRSVDNCHVVSYEDFTLIHLGNNNSGYTRKSMRITELRSGDWWQQQRRRPLGNYLLLLS